MREIVWDTETTGLDPFTGDRLVEIGAVELINHVRTGREYHQYINPLRSMSEEVIRVHGLTEEFLADKPTFDEIVDEFLAFVGTDSKLVAHNASFDMKFLNFQLKELGKPEIGEDRVVDSLLIARKKFPGARVNLDELCRRFGVDNSNRTVHGALLDAQLLADVYLELLGGYEPGFLLSETPVVSAETVLAQIAARPVRPARVFPVPPEETEQFNQFMTQIKDALWFKEPQGDSNT